VILFLYLHTVNVLLALVTNTFLFLLHKSPGFSKECEQQKMGASKIGSCVARFW